LRDDIVTAMLAGAEAFLDLRAAHGGTAWRITDLPDGPGRVRAAVSARLGLPRDRAEPRPVAVTRPVGLIAPQSMRAGRESAASVRDDPGLSAVLLAPLGRLTAAQLTWVAGQLEDRDARITPWRSVVLPRLDDGARVLREAAGLGFGTDEASPWLRVTACAGRPGCASALADVQADAAGFAARWPGRIVHVSGCGRHCGRPAATEIDVTATSEEYQVAGV
jgi:precorrin-3B synthase